MENTGISWAHNTWNPWLGCDKVAPECRHCYIHRTTPLKVKGRKPWGELYRTGDGHWKLPKGWDTDCAINDYAKRVFTCSLSDFFHAKADPWRDEAWRRIRKTSRLTWLILTKRPDRIHNHLPADWGQGYPNVWLGVSTGCKQTLNKMDVLRKIPAAVRWVSTEPLLEDISQQINLDGFHWVVTGGESGGNKDSKEYLYNPKDNWRTEEAGRSRRTMMLRWAENLRDVTKAAGLPFMFKQVTSARSGQGVNALGQDWHEFPDAPNGLKWAPRNPIDPKNLWTPVQIENLRKEQMGIRA